METLITLAILIGIAGIGYFCRQAQLLVREVQDIKNSMDRLSDLIENPIRAKSIVQSPPLPVDGARENEVFTSQTNCNSVSNSSMAEPCRRFRRNVETPGHNASSEVEPMAVNRLSQDSSPYYKNNLASEHQTGYFGNPIQESQTEAYFNELFQKGEGYSERFIVEVKGHLAYFSPITEDIYFNSLKSSEQMRFAVEFRGCAISDAKSISQIEPGQALKIDGKWKIQKKAVVNLY